MADVIGRAVVTITPEFAGFRQRVTSEMTAAGQAAGRAFSNTFEAALKGLTPALGQLVEQLRAVDTAVNLIDASDIEGIGIAAEAASAALSETAVAATTLDGALTSIDASDLREVEVAAAAATGALGSTAAAAKTVDASINSIDPAGVNKTEAAAAGAGVSMASLKKWALAAGGALAGLGAAGVTVAGKMEQARIAFTGLLGTQDAADQFLETLQSFAATTPFEFDQVLTASQKLMSLGQTGEQVIDTLTTIGNAAAAVGASGESIEGVVVALAQIQAKGKLSAQELNQIAERLPNFSRGKFLDKLAADFGVTRDQIAQMAEQGEIAADRAIPALLASLKEVPGALGAMDRQSQSLIGRLSTLKDNIRFGLAAAFQGLADTISPQLIPLGDTIQGSLEKLGGGIAKVASTLLPALVPLIRLLGPVLGGVLSVLATLIGPVVSGFQKLAEFLAPIAEAVLPALDVAFTALMNAMRPVLDLIAPLAAAFATLIAVQRVASITSAALGKAMKFLGEQASKALSLIANHPFIAAAAAIAGLFYGMWKNSEQLRNALSRLGGVLSGVFAPALDAVRGVISSVSGVEFTGFGEILGWLGDRLAIAVNWLADRLPGAIQAASDAFDTYLRPGLETIVGWLQTAADWFSQLWSALGFGESAAADTGSAMDSMGAKSDTLIGKLVTLKDTVVFAFAPISDWAANAVTQLGSLWSTLQSGDDVAQGAGETIDSIFGNTGALVGPVRELTDAFGSAWNAAGSLLQGDWDGFGQQASQAFQGVGAAASEFAANLPSLLSGLGETISGPVKQGFTGIGDWISEALGEAPIIGPLSTTLTGVLKQVFDLVGGQLDLWSAILSFDPEAIKASLGNIGSTISSALGTVLKGAGGILTDVSDIFTDWFSGGLASLKDKVKDIPILGEIASLTIDRIKVAFETAGGLADVLAGILTFDKDKILEGLGTITDAIKEFLLNLPGEIIGLITDTVTNAADLATKLSEWFSNAFTDVTDWLSKDGIPTLFDWLKDLPETVGNLIVTYGPDVAKTLIGGLLTALKAVLFDIPKWIVTEFLPTVIGAIVEHGPELLSAIGNFLGSLPSLLGSILSGVGNVIGSIITGIAGLAVDWAGDLGEGFVSLLVAAWNWVVDNGPTILATVAGWLAELPGTIIGFIGNVGEALLGMFVSAFEWVRDNGPTILGVIKDFFIGLPLKVLEFIGNIGEYLLGAFVVAFRWVRDNGPTILADLAEFITGLPGKIIEWIGNLGETIGGWLTSAWQWLTDNADTILGSLRDFFIGLPGKILEWLGNLGEKIGGWLTSAWQWVTDNAETVLTIFLDFWRGLPDRIWTAVGDLGAFIQDRLVGTFQWVTGELPGIIAGFLDWFIDLPSKIIEKVGDLGGRLVDWAGGAFDWLKDHLGALFQGVIDWFADLPGKIVSAIGDLGGAAADFGQTLLNKFKEFFNVSVIDRINEFSIDLPLAGRVDFPDLPHLAEGMVVTQPMTVVVGEKGPEVVIPLTDPERARQLMEESGLLRLILQPEPAGPIPMFAEGGIINGPTLAVVGEKGPEVVIPLDDPARAKELALASGLLDVVQTEGVQDQVALNMQTLSDLGIASVQPLLDWFTNFTPAVILALQMFGETVWAAVSGTFAFFAHQVMAVFDGLSARIAAWPGEISLALSPTGYAIWGNMAAGMDVFRVSFVEVFNGITTTIEGWKNGIVATVNSIPSLIAGVSGEITKALAAPLHDFAKDVWNPFASALNTAFDQIPATADINIPELPTAHEGGIIGVDRLPGTGGPLASDEMVVKMQRGEGVLPVDVMRRLSTSQFRALQRGRFDLSHGQPEVIGNQIGQGPGGSGGSSATGVLPDSITQDLEAAIRSLDGAVARLRSEAWHVPIFLAEMFTRVSADALEFVRTKLREHNNNVMSSIGLPPGFYPPGFDIEAWREIFRANKRPGSYPIILQFLQAAGVPYIVTSAVRPGGTSYHASGRAVDLIGPNSAGAVDHPEFLRINQAFWPFLDGTITELIYAGPGGRSDKAYDAATMAGHHNHVHVALAAGAYLKRPTVGLLAEAGPEVVLPLTKPDRALQLALDSGLFDVLARARGGPGAATAPPAAPTTVETRGATPADTGFLGGGPGNTYNIYGITMDQVRAEIRARDAATLRSRP